MIATQKTSRRAPAERRALPRLESTGRDQSLEASPSIVSDVIGTFVSDGEDYELERHIFLGAQGGGEQLRIGIFAGVHGDEPEGVHAALDFLRVLERRPEIAKGYCVFIYPLCNPTGFEDRTRVARCGKDLNREFWRRSNEPEVALLEAEISKQKFHGIVTLHSDNTSNGMYGFVRGATLTKHLLLPALRAAELVLPRDKRSVIDGFPAREGLIKDCYDGVLSAPPGTRPKPFEIILETPQSAPQFRQQQAAILALNTILIEYRKFIAYAANI